MQISGKSIPRQLLICKGLEVGAYLMCSGRAGTAGSGWNGVSKGEGAGGDMDREVAETDLVGPCGSQKDLGFTLG